MAEIFVVFPPNDQPTVSHEIERVPSGNRISWDFVSCNPRVHYVIVEFDDPEAKFFNDNGTETNRIWKQVKHGKAFVHGEVRYNGKKPPKVPVWGKYNVIGCERLVNDQPDGAIYELDPVIVTGDPG